MTYVSEGVRKAAESTRTEADVRAKRADAEPAWETIFKGMLGRQSKSGPTYAALAFAESEIKFVLRGLCKALYASLDAAPSERELLDVLRDLADAADDVGVRFFDTDTMSPEVEKMQAATLAARAAIAKAEGK